jgi:hypothetical protein
MRNRSRVTRIAWVIALAVVPAAFGQAQPADSSLHPGAKIRVTPLSWALERVTGTLVQVDGDSLQVQTRKGIYAISRSEIARLDVSRGKKSAAGKGLEWGFLGGALAGAVVSTLVCSTNTCTFIEGPDAPAVWIPLGTAIGAAGGALVGLVIGSLTHTDRWERLSAPPSTSFYAGYGGPDRGALLGVRVAW